MSYKYKSIELSKISVIGAGQIGPDIALHFAKSLYKYDIKISVLDVSSLAIEKAKEKIFKKINKGTESGVFKIDQAERIKSSIIFTTDYKEVVGSGLVVEAATEDEGIKDKIFKQVEALTDTCCIYLSNSSHMQPEVIFKNITDKSRCLVAHYFFPAEINPAIEIVPGRDTNLDITKLILGFYESIGKVPVKVKSSYGYAVDPVFEGICQTAILCLESGMGNEKEIDKAAVKALGLGVGPFTALNLTGGNPITAHGLDELGRLIIPWFKTPETLKRKVAEKANWEVAQRGENIELTKYREEKLVNEFLGAYFALSSYILDLEIINISDFNMICEISLVIKAPFELMNSIGIEKASHLVKEFCVKHKNFPFPKTLEQANKAGGWQLKDIVSEKIDQVATITIRRPKVLNALNLSVLMQIQEALEEFKQDASIEACVITGFGTKAFVSGADINMLAALKNPQEGYQNSQTFQSILNYIENYSKPIVCAMNGFAFGGGNELAMACTTRICKKGLPVLVCQPEVNLGFIPGAGGTQRLPRIIGVEAAAEILRTGKSISAEEAYQLGLVYKLTEGDLLEEAVDVAKKIAAKSIDIKIMPREPITNNGNPKQIDLGHLSKKIDEILTKAIYEGSRLSLKEGLELESRMFGECLKTEDMKIGLENFKLNGPKQKAVFKHK
ncbi:MAG: 3-hydroxyacyl-CoA dehydrogenase/enoyl-CoA hydratase family protein [Bacteroidia bacterium]|nr:3-hydroxyacyl-CoA dehydrogenase/enoyl-CoA hydratase family protein [Bacteroidia bacterium]